MISMEKFYNKKKNIAFWTIVKIQHFLDIVDFMLNYKHRFVYTIVTDYGVMIFLFEKPLFF